MHNKLIEFLMYSYFGVSNEDLKELDDPKKLIKKCAFQAYNDLRRTMRYSKATNDRDKEAFRNDIYNFISCNIVIMLENASESYDYDTWHSSTCTALENIINCKYKNILKDDFHFCYGQAQKWLNMTIKYMLLLGFWDKKFDPIKAKLHVPVDRYILKSINNSENKFSINIEDAIIPVEHNYESEPSKFSRHFHEDKKKGQDKSAPWSKWNYTDYTNFQTKLMTAINPNKQGNHQIPIDWEFDAWLSQAKLESSIK